ncbi:hypothetical protein LDENG_00130620 [Lucifuga dentata]|nr:hypothetical protein LDENG_00130620 [Lucifuga dentata]
MSSYSRPEGHRTPAFTRAKHLPMSKSDLERDSGFSDASSEYLSTFDFTDSEDACRTGSIIGQDQICPQVAMMGGSYGGMSPMIIMNNFVLKQPCPSAPAEKQWGFPSPLEAMPQSQVVFLQPMMSNGNSSSPKTESRRQSRSHASVPKSYPRIAPYPGEAPPKRLGSSRVKSSVSGDDQRPRRHHHGHKASSTPAPQPALQIPVRPVTTFEAANTYKQADDNQEQLISKSQPVMMGASPQPSLPHDFRIAMADKRLHADTNQDGISTESNKMTRFSNTYNILNQSGLLGITLRTKQLMRGNRCTQVLLQQLQEQTALLMEALNTGDPQLWTKLQLSMQDKDHEQWGSTAQSSLG